MTRAVRNYSTARALQALCLFARNSYTPPALASEMQIGERAARHLIYRMVKEGFLEAEPDQHHPQYRLAPEAYQLGLSLIEAGLRVGEQQRQRWSEPITIGQCLRAYRRSRGISQEAFADLAGLGRMLIGEIERGKATISYEDLGDIAARLGVDPMDIVLAARAA